MLFLATENKYYFLLGMFVKNARNLNSSHKIGNYLDDSTLENYSNIHLHIMIINNLESQFFPLKKKFFIFRMVKNVKDTGRHWTKTITKDD